MKIRDSEQAYIDGARAAWRNMLRLCMGELRGDPAVPEAEIVAAQLQAERAEVVSVLRRVCAEHGDNDWPDDLHLADVIDKHLERHLSVSFVPTLKWQPAPDADWGPDCGLVVAHGDDHGVRFEIVPPAAVWVVIGHVDYEFDDIQSIHADEQSARAERDRLATEARQASEDCKLAAHDLYTVERYEVER